MLYIPEAPNQAFKYPENNPKFYRNPGERNMIYEDVRIVTKDDLKLVGWFIKQKNPLQHETIIFFHENAGNIGNRLGSLEQLYFELEVNILIVGYRGYGHSQGTPNEQGIELDAEAIFKFALENREINNSKIYFFGKSLGGAVAIQLAEKVQDQICGMILENTFVSISEMVDHIFPYLTYFKKFIQRIFWPSIDRIPNIRVPIFFIVGTNDEIVPAYHTGKLFEAAKNSVFKDMYKVEGGMHNDTWFKGGKDYLYAIKDFIDKCAQPELRKSQKELGITNQNSAGSQGATLSHRRVAPDQSM